MKTLRSVLLCAWVMWGVSFGWKNAIPIMGFETLAACNARLEKAQAAHPGETVPLVCLPDTMNPSGKESKP